MEPEVKIAMCYSGQVGGIYKAYRNQYEHVLLPNNCDVYCYTSDAVSQKGNYSTNLPPSNSPMVYLPKGVGWRRNYNTYGIIYNIEQKFIKDLFKNMYGNRLKAYEVESESVGDENHDTNMTKWEWMRLRQLKKLKECNNLLKESGESYDVVMRSRFEFVTRNQVNVSSIINKSGGIENNKRSIFVFGSFPCTPPMVFMDEYFCDGFMFGTPEVMDVVASLADKEAPYPPNPKYVANWEKWGDSIEHQFRTHMLENDIEIKYIGTKRSDYENVR